MPLGHIYESNKYESNTPSDVAYQTLLILSILALL